jgi:hypothetical protein
MLLNGLLRIFRTLIDSIIPFDKYAEFGRPISDLAVRAAIYH